MLSFSSSSTTTALLQVQVSVFTKESNKNQILTSNISVEMLSYSSSSIKIVCTLEGQTGQWSYFAFLGYKSLKVIFSPRQNPNRPSKGRALCSLQSSIVYFTWFLGMTRLEKSTLSFRHCQNWRGDLVAQIDFDTILKVKKLPTLRAGGRQEVIYAMHKRKGVFSGKSSLIFIPCLYCNDYVSDI